MTFEYQLSAIKAKVLDPKPETYSVWSENGIALPPASSTPAPEATSAVRSIGLSSLCLFMASLTIVVGMILGLYMALSEDHSLGPVHAHLNVVGWVSLFLIGLFHRTHPQAGTKLAWIQAGLFVIGYILMTGALAGLLLGGSALFFAPALVGALLLIVSMVLFSAIVWRSART